MTIAAGAGLGVVWSLPFAGMLLSIALLPIAAPCFWHRHALGVAIAWSLAFLLPYGASFGAGQAAHALAETLLHDYLPFIALLTALYATAGGIRIMIGRRATPAFNIGLLAVGAALASVIGTTGASMLLIRPLLRANAHRRDSSHLVIFFIFVVGNVGGALTPIGDPPLLIGFLQGVGFFWTTRHLFAPMLFLLVGLLAACYGVDTRRARREPPGSVAADEPIDRRIRIQGVANLLPLATVIGLVLLGGMWKTDSAFDLLGVELGLAALARDVGLLAATLLSLALTPAGVRRGNEFSWRPMAEVAELFLGIFLTMIPVIAMLRTGASGPFAWLVHAVTEPQGQPVPWAYFWAAGLASSVLDNAPTYLIFFELAGGDAERLMTDHATTLTAISAGAVFMGALTYIGNAPNLMVRAIAERRGVRMPGFFAYLAWSGAVLIPLFVLSTLVFFSGR